ncbi:Uncharacterised protein [Serratia fonticola]|uniref:Uncharacterized protein n=1 Tax=Serratia fonticola TaxID=47917 RepID=A0A4U9WMQ1_SERFO|nr:Uncharacterised protein [Serratia fonticola]
MWQGLRVIVGSGTNQERILLGWNEQNQREGLKPAQPIYLTDDASAIFIFSLGGQMSCSARSR